MAAGSHSVVRPDTRLDAAALPVGWAVTSSGRLSIATEPDRLPGQFPFRSLDLVILDDALTQASRQSK